MNATTEHVIGGVLEPIFRTLPLETARRIAAIEADSRLQLRVEQLARKANEGELSSQELQEYESYVAAGDILATLQALARRVLKDAGT